MIYIIVNDLLVEAKTVTEVHLQMEVKRHHIQKSEVEFVRNCKTEDNNILTEIFKELFNEIKKRELK